MDSLPYSSTLSTPCRPVREVCDPEALADLTYKTGHHICIQLNITLAFPVDVHVQLDAIDFRLGDCHVGELDRHMSKVDLGEMQGRQWSGEHCLEHWLDNLFDHVRSIDGHVGPELGDYLVQEAYVLISGSLFMCLVRVLLTRGLSVRFTSQFLDQVCHCESVYLLGQIGNVVLSINVQHELEVESREQPDKSQLPRSSEVDLQKESLVWISKPESRAGSQLSTLPRPGESCG